MYILQFGHTKFILVTLNVIEGIYLKLAAVVSTHTASLGQFIFIIYWCIITLCDLPRILVILISKNLVCKLVLPVGGTLFIEMMKYV